MNDDEGMAKRRARLRALRERYEQQPVDWAGARPATGEPDAGGGPGRLESRRGRQGRGAMGAEAERQGRGLLQRLARFLTEPDPEDSLVPGTRVGAQRLRRAVRFLEQRARTTPGGAGERIQRLLRFLTQDIPGEPMAEGVNIQRLRQLLERVESAPRPEAKPQAGPERAGEAGESAAGRDNGSRPRPDRPEPEEQAPPVTQVTEPTVVEPADAAVADTIEAMEQTLAQLLETARQLRVRLDAARRRADASSIRAGGEERHSVTASAGSPKPADPARTGADSGTTTQAPPDADWFLEFLE